MQFKTTKLSDPNSKVVKKRITVKMLCYKLVALIVNIGMKKSFKSTRVQAL